MRPKLDALDRRLSKLEVGSLPTPPYVVRLSHEEVALPDRERERLVRLRSGGFPVVVMPAVCATMEEWLARYAPQKALDA